MVGGWGGVKVKQEGSRGGARGRGFGVVNAQE